MSLTHTAFFPHDIDQVNYRKAPRDDTIKELLSSRSPSSHFANDDRAAVRTGQKVQTTPEGPMNRYMGIKYLFVQPLVDDVMPSLSNLINQSIHHRAFFLSLLYVKRKE